MKDELTDINRQIANAEHNNETEKISHVLSTGMVFRRANGVVVDKVTYLAQQKQTVYHSVQLKKIGITALAANVAVADCVIEASGTRADNTAFSGVFRNIRFFSHTQDGWQLYAWHNTALDMKQVKKELSTEKEPAVMADASRFSGIAVLRKLYEDPIAGAMKWQEVIFHPGSRTHWHTHTGEQVLLVTAGKAIVVRKDANGAIQIEWVSAGQETRIEPGQLHWHGSSARQFMVHLAFNRKKEQLDTTYWFDAVSDKSYDDAQLSIY